MTKYSLPQCLKKACFSFKDQTLGLIAVNGQTFLKNVFRRKSGQGS